MDTESLLKLLNAHDVKYVIIGASAFPVHGYVRATLDLDIFIAPEHDNAQRTLLALKEFGYDLDDLQVDDLLSKKILIRQYIVETDIHPFAAGVSFEEIWNSRVEGLYGTTPAHFASLDALIKMKKAAGRMKDLEDLKYLQKLHDKKK
jgi:hypothetical protein